MRTLNKATLNKSPRGRAPRSGMGCKAQNTAMAWARAWICNATGRPGGGCPDRERLVQRGSHWRRLGLAAAVLALTGCASTVPVVVQPINCPVDAALLAGRCATPKTIPDSSNFGDVLTLYQQDRQALQDCGQRTDTLARLIAACQSTIDQYNQRLLEINRASTTKP